MAKIKRQGVISYSERWEVALRRNFSHLMATYRLDGEQVFQSGFSAVDGTECSFVMAHRMEFDGVEGTEARQRLIERACAQLRKTPGKGKGTRFEDFLPVLDTLACDFLRQPKQLFHVVQPLQVNPNDVQARRSFRFLNIDLKASRWEQIQRRFKTEDWFAERSPQRLELDPGRILGFTPLVASILARDCKEAFLTANAAFRLLSGVIILIKCSGIRQSQFGGFPRPLTDLLPPATYAVFAEDGRFEQSWWNVDIQPDNFMHTPVSLNDSEHKYIDQWSRRLKRPASTEDTTGLLISAIQKYGRAHEIANWREAFLEFWQIIELLTFPFVGPDTRFSMNDVCRRVNIFLEPEERLADLLEVTSEIRNNLVHKGEFIDADLEAVSNLKSIVDRCIYSIDGLRKKYPEWKQLNVFYQYAGQQDATLKEQESVIRHIQALRKDRARRIAALNLISSK